VLDALAALFQEGAHLGLRAGLRLDQLERHAGAFAAAVGDTLRDVWQHVPDVPAVDAEHALVAVDHGFEVVDDDADVEGDDLGWCAHGSLLASGRDR
jgi:hypothetical protein